MLTPSVATTDCCTSCAGDAKICHNDVRRFDFGRVIVSLCRDCREQLKADIERAAATTESAG